MAAQPVAALVAKLTRYYREAWPEATRELARHAIAQKERDGVEWTTWAEDVLRRVREANADVDVGVHAVDEFDLVMLMELLASGKLRVVSVA